MVEWANVTAGQDIDFAFAESWEYLLREGYAVAVVSAQNVGVDRLKTWSPERYGTLSVAVNNVDRWAVIQLTIAA
ncbi:alpha/beta hydrolase domain-containing protein [Mesorhizobium sp. ISC25]|uniref:alpha/beta hydrolase domain-containing protein n=1 Tax=Mesorhizobium sp. ISC25 TaxID=3077335 RepID=UPI0035D9A55B